MERWWNDFKLVWLAKRVRPKAWQNWNNLSSRPLNISIPNELMHQKTA